MSCSRRCDFTLCVDQQWYLTLGNFEYAEDDEDCTTYGPFATEEATERYLRKFSNPGGICTDDSGTAPVPTNVRRP